MNDLKSLDQLSTAADELLGGLHADERMRLAIRRAAEEKPKKNAQLRMMPAICCAALALCCAGVISARLGAGPLAARNGNEVVPAATETVAIDTIAAGELPAMDAGVMMADLGDNARVRSRAAGGESLFAQGDMDVPMISLGNAVYQMLSTPRSVGSGLLGAQVGSVTWYDEMPSLASPAELNAGLSNVAQAGAAIHALSGVADSAMVAAEVDGSIRVFQRVSYAGKGPAGSSLEDTFSVRGRVQALALSGVGELTGEKANAAAAVLLDYATLKATDAPSMRQTLTVTLENGLKMQLSVSGDTLGSCGSWSCPEFFEAFEAAL